MTNKTLPDRYFVTEYHSVNGAVNFNIGDIAQVVEITNTDAEIIANGDEYTLPIMDFIESTKNISDHARYDIQNGKIVHVYDDFGRCTKVGKYYGE